MLGTEERVPGLWEIYKKTTFTKQTALVDLPKWQFVKGSRLVTLRIVGCQFIGRFFFVSFIFFL